MATTKSSYDFKKALTDYTVYVPLGATQVFIEKAKELPGKARSIRLGAWRDNVTEMYQDLAQRGHKLADSVRRSAYTQRAVEQTKVARTQVKAAATSVRKAAGTTSQATRAAAKKVS